MKKRKSANRIRCSIENQLRPLRAASIFERNDAQATAIEQIRERLHAVHGSVTRFEGPDPCIALNVVADVAGFDDMARRECGSESRNERARREFPRCQRHSARSRRRRSPEKDEPWRQWQCACECFLWLRFQNHKWEFRARWWWP